MNILVWGLGYVGTVSAACLADLGHEVVGVDSNPDKVQTIAAGRSALQEPGLDSLVSKAVACGRLHTNQHGADLVRWADVSLVCVGTPSTADGTPDLVYVRKVAGEIGDGLRNAGRYHVVVLRSTVFPGTTRSVLLPLLEERSRLKAGKDFGVATNPEFMREASAVADFRCPVYTVIGQLDNRSGEMISALYRGIAGLLKITSFEEAELLKLSCNAFHALKVGFANEIGRLCQTLSLNSRGIMELFCSDTRLNISAAYLEPGFAYGGSCLPKDLLCLVSNAQRLGVDLPIVKSIAASNDVHIEAARLRVLQLNVDRIAVLGVSFKTHTDDLRESAAVRLIQRLSEDGLDITVYDPNVQMDRLFGANREYIQRELPGICRILRTSIQEALNDRQAVVITQKRPEFSDAAAAAASRGLIVVDLAGLNPSWHTRRRSTSPEE